MRNKLSFNLDTFYSQLNKIKNKNKIRVLVTHITIDDSIENFELFEDAQYALSLLKVKAFNFKNKSYLIERSELIFSDDGSKKIDLVVMETISKDLFINKFMSA